MRRAGNRSLHPGGYVCARLPAAPEQLLQSIIDLQDKIQGEGTLRGREFDLARRQQPKRALVELNGCRSSAAHAAQCCSGIRQNSDAGQCNAAEFWRIQLRASTNRDRPCNDCRIDSPISGSEDKRVPGNDAGNRSAERAYAALEFLKRQRRFDLLVDITCVDYLHYRGATDRFGLVYLLAGTETNERITVRVYLNEPDLTVPSVVPLWEGANWLEREVYDMFGIAFAGHPDLRRILLPEEFTAPGCGTGGVARLGGRCSGPAFPRPCRTPDGDG